ncbi:MAG: TonB family protein [Ignavibacteriales bacterium]|nr:TonB family protein [Ignavibacteriales bacterium]
MALKKNPKYDLKMKYKRFFEIALILSLGLLIIAFKFFPDVKETVAEMESVQELIDVEDIDQTKQENQPPPPPKPPIPVEAPSDNVLDDIAIGDMELDENEIVAPPPPPVQEEKKEEETEPVFFVAVEEQPTPIGGIEEIQKNIIYPEIAKKAGVQGKVYIKAYVDENGIVVKTEVLKGIGAGCDEAAADAVMKTRFNPGKQRGKPVKCQVTVPVHFVLQN